MLLPRVLITLTLQSLQIKSTSYHHRQSIHLMFCPIISTSCTTEIRKCPKTSTQGKKKNKKKKKKEVNQEIQRIIRWQYSYCFKKRNRKTTHVVYFHDFEMPQRLITKGCLSYATTKRLAPSY
jgi:hypothetical protein